MKRAVIRGKSRAGKTATALGNAGILVTRSPDLASPLKTVPVQMGGTIDPHQARLVLRGMRPDGGTGRDRRMEGEENS